MATTPLFISQAEVDHVNVPVIQGDVIYLEDETIAQDAARSEALADMTLMSKVASSGQWTPLRDVDPAATPGKLVCGAFGSNLATMQAITDGSFQVQIDGETAISITGLDFSNIKSIGATSAIAVCGANGANLAGWQAITDGSFKITVDGTLIHLEALDFSVITALDELADTINYKAAGRFLAFYDSKADVVWFRSLKTGSLSTLSALTAGGSGTDISGASYLNGLTGTITLTQGTGSDEPLTDMAGVINAALAGRAVCYFDGSAFTFVSPTVGVNSAVSVLTAGASGTDISGASYLNGLTGTGTATAGSGLDGSHLPAGIYRGGSIAAATIVAGTTTGCIVIPNKNIVIEDHLVLENSLDLDSSIITSIPMTIRDYLHSIGFVPQAQKAADANI